MKKPLSKAAVSLIISFVVLFFAAAVALPLLLFPSSSVSLVRAVSFSPEEYPNTIVTIVEQDGQRSVDVQQSLPVTGKFNSIPIEQFDAPIENYGEVVSMNSPRTTETVLEKTYQFDTSKGPVEKQIAVYGNGYVSTKTLQYAN